MPSSTGISQTASINCSKNVICCSSIAVQDSAGWLLQEDTAIGKPDALGLKHVERAGEMGNHCIYCRIARSLPLTDPTARKLSAGRKVLHGETGKRTTSA